MQVNLEGGNAAYRIYAYDDDSVTIVIPKIFEAVPEGHQDDDDQLPMWRDVQQTNLLVMPNKLIRNWSNPDFNLLEEQNFEALKQYQLEIVLLGTGATLKRPPTAILAPLINAGIGVEIMNTGAACRTYNILMGDERRVAAVLFIK